MAILRGDGEGGLAQSRQIPLEELPQLLATADFDFDGFVHCSYLEQVADVANSFYAGREDLLLLEINSEKVDARIVDENLDGGEERFPHVYGAIPVTAILATHQLSPDANGEFRLQIRPGR